LSQYQTYTGTSLVCDEAWASQNGLEQIPGDWGSKYPIYQGPKSALDAILKPDWYESLRKAPNTYHTGELAVSNSKIENEKKGGCFWGF
jgi:hypothetical protein